MAALWTRLAPCLLPLALAVLPAHAALVPVSPTAGTEQCDNKGTTGTATAIRYLPDSGRLEVPLVFVPGSGWYRATLQAQSATDLRFRLVDFAPSCETLNTPATYFLGTQIVLLPEVNYNDGSGRTFKFDAQLRFDSNSGLFTPTEIWETDSSAPPVPPDPATPKAGSFAATVEAVRLEHATGPFAVGATIALTRIKGARIGNVEAGCDSRHLHGSGVSIDSAGSYNDPNPSGCGYGKIVAVEEETIDHGAGYTPLPSGIQYCGPDIAASFFSRLKHMHSRLKALPDSERGVFDGTMFLARNGTNMDFVTGKLKDISGTDVCPTPACQGTGHTSTFTLCGLCIISHVDNDMEFGFVAQMLGVPWSVQLAGGHGWDVLQRGSLDPLPSQIAYRIGNDLAAAITANPNVSDAQLCTAFNASRIRTGVATYKSGAQLFAAELTQFGKGACTPCPYGCPDTLVTKDFATQSWVLDNGGTATSPPR